MSVRLGDTAIDTTTDANSPVVPLSKSDFKAAKKALQLQRYATLTSIKQQKADRQDLRAEATALLPNQAAADVSTTIADAKASLLKALPWVIGGTAVAAVLFIVWRKKRRN